MDPRIKAIFQESPIGVLLTNEEQAGIASIFETAVKRAKERYANVAEQADTDTPCDCPICRDAAQAPAPPQNGILDIPNRVGSLERIVADLYSRIGLVPNRVGRLEQAVADLYSRLGVVQR